MARTLLHDSARQSLINGGAIACEFTVQRVQGRAFFHAEISARGDRDLAEAMLGVLIEDIQAKNGHRPHHQPLEAPRGETCFGIATPVMMLGGSLRHADAYHDGEVVTYHTSEARLTAECRKLCGGRNFKHQRPLIQRRAAARDMQMIRDGEILVTDQKGQWRVAEGWVQKAMALEEGGRIVGDERLGVQAYAQYLAHAVNAYLTWAGLEGQVESRHAGEDRYHLAFALPQAEFESRLLHRLRQGSTAYHRAADDASRGALARA